VDSAHVGTLICQANGSNAKPMAPTCAESSEPPTGTKSRSGNASHQPCEVSQIVPWNLSHLPLPRMRGAGKVNWLKSQSII